MDERIQILGAHTEGGALTRQCHERQRLISSPALQTGNFDVVVTTFETVTQEEDFLSRSIHLALSDYR